jgi:hypothetical protein
LNLAFFMDIGVLQCWNDTTCIALEIPHRIFDLDTKWWGTSPYVKAWANPLDTT